jgi:RNA polymerase sigma-70 factor (ECF subfamily)
MDSDQNEAPSGKRLREQFATTQWSVVLAAADRGVPKSSEALAQLCETYWYPLYAYLRRRGSDVHEAQDLTQSFFTHLLASDAVAKAHPDRGRFRAFLLTSLKNFVANQWNKARAQKRGGGKARLSLDFESGESRYRIEPFHELTPEKLYERHWAIALLDRVLSRLQSELTEAGKGTHFEQLKGTLAGEAAPGDYDRAAESLGVTPAAAKQVAYRMRKRYRELLREEVARTLVDENAAEDEIGRLFAAFGT